MTCFFGLQITLANHQVSRINQLAVNNYVRWISGTQKSLRSLIERKQMYMYTWIMCTYLPKICTNPGLSWSMALQQVANSKSSFTIQWLCKIKYICNYSRHQYQFSCKKSGWHTHGFCTSVTFGFPLKVSFVYMLLIQMMLTIETNCCC